MAIDFINRVGWIVIVTDWGSGIAALNHTGSEKNFRVTYVFRGLAFSMQITFNLESTCTITTAHLYCATKLLLSNDQYDSFKLHKINRLVSLSRYIYWYAYMWVIILCNIVNRLQGIKSYIYYTKSTHLFKVEHSTNSLFLFSLSLFPVLVYN